MEYVLLINESDLSFQDRMNENQQSYWGGWSAYVKAISEAGIVVSGSGLQGPDTATTIIFKKDEKIVHDGPFIDAKEQLGGFFVIKVENLDQALE